MDNVSIASDFSVIPDTSVNMDGGECVGTPVSLNASFMRASQMFASGSTVNSFDKVTFIRTDASKITEIGLSVTYSTSDLLTPKSSDRLALYKLDFSSPHDYLCYKWASVSKGSLQGSSESCSSSHTVIFEENILPKEDPEEFYRICYLTHEGQIVGISTPFQLKQPELDEISMEKNSLLHKVSLLEEEKERFAEKNISLETSLKKLSISNEELTLANNVLKTQMESFLKKTEAMTASIMEKENLIVELEENLRVKTDVADQAAKDKEELENRIADLVLQMNTLKENFSNNEELKSIAEERHSVLEQDNEELKSTLNKLKQQVEELQSSLRESLEGREASEKIAIDLSQRLQEARKEYTAVSVANLSLLKKVKKLKKRLSQMEDALDTDTVFVPSLTSQENDYDDLNDKEGSSYEETFAHDEKDQETLTESAPLAGAEASCGPSICPSSSCSHNTQQLSQVVNEKMEAIVKQLTEQIESLKTQISVKSDSNSNCGSRIGLSDQSQTESNWDVASTAVTTAREGNMDSEGPPASRLLYSNAFLPAQRTAPVFLPSQPTSAEYGECHTPAANRSTTPSAPYPSPSVMSTTNESTPAAPVPEPASSFASSVLPVPLQPQATATALQAAVMSHFGGEQQPSMGGEPPLDPSGGSYSHARQGRDSDDEDYHSTGDSGDAAQHGASRQPENEKQPIQCPMCSLVFLPTAMRLMEEHINSHLEFVCPICSEAFQRNLQKEFEQHVESHFDSDPSTRRARHSRSARRNLFPSNLFSIYWNLFNRERNSQEWDN